MRKRVTVAFCDLQNSTRLAEQLDAEPVHRLIGRYFEQMTEAAKRHGASIDYSGDAIVAVFGVPELHEDDAMRAVRAAAEMKEALVALNHELDERWDVQLDVRIGLNTGEIVAGDPAREVRMVVADAFNVAARLEQVAGPGEVLLADTTYRLVRDIVRVMPIEPLTLKGKSRPVHAFKLLSVVDLTPGVVRRHDSPLVGREPELDTLLEAQEHSVRERQCILATVTGEAGMGKSRLVAELTSRLADHARVLRGRCLPYGKGITFWPLAEIVKEAASVNEGDSATGAIAKVAALMGGSDDADVVAERVAGAIGVAEPSSDREGLFWAIRRLVSALARDGPLVLVFDDFHWAEPTLADLVLELVRERWDSPILLVAAARPEEEAPAEIWEALEQAGTAVRLGSLDRSQSVDLVEHVLGGSAALPDHALDWIAGAARGNPLFLEETLRMLIDEGLLRREGDGWTTDTDLAEVPVPPSIHALVAASLERLDLEQRLMLERAAVVGEEFVAGAVEQLLEAPPGGIRPTLETLVEKGFVEPGGTPFAGEPGLKFRHLLVRDVAYAEILKEVRLELHERHADWLEQKAGERAGEFSEILGYHLERAVQYRAEIWPGDPRSLELGRRASGRLAAAGRRALALGDMPAAANLLERATLLLGEDEPDRHDLLPKLAFAVAETGDQARADELFDDWIEAARRGRSLLVYRQADGREQIYDLDVAPPRVTVGRRSTSDIPLEWDYEVSRLHAVLERTADGWALADEGLSKNGSFVNGEAVTERRTLEDGDVVRLGATSLLFRTARDADRAREARTKATTVTAPGLLGGAELSEGERWLLAALCRPLLATAGRSTPATDDEIANELEISLGEVEQGLRALYERFQTVASSDAECRMRLAARAIRSGALEYPGLR